MALISCKECGTQISDQATSCPKCGIPRAAKAATVAAPPKKGLGCGGIIGLVFFGVVVMAVLGKGVQENETKRNISAAPEITATAQEILKDYGSNEVAADQKYKGKIVQITGVVDSIGKDILDDPYVTVGTGKQFELPQVQCHVGKPGESALASLKPKQKITVKGKVSGLFGNVGLNDCVVVP